VPFVQRAEGTHVLVSDGEKQNLVARPAVHTQLSRPRAEKVSPRCGEIFRLRHSAGTVTHLRYRIQEP